jgi:hypothetical protein
MKTFTVRQLDRETAKVMQACDNYGAVRIKRRDGRTYTLAADNRKKEKTVINPPDIMARLRKNFGDMVISKEQSDFVDKLIAGE